MDHIFGPILLWIPIVIVVIMIWWFSTHRSVTAKTIHVAGHAPAKPSEPVHHEVHKKDDHGNGHDGHGHSHGTPLWKTILGWCTALAAVALLLVFCKTWVVPKFGLDQIPGGPRELQQRISETHGTMRSTGPTCQTDPIEPYTITAPPKEEGWSVRVPVPKCYRIRFCDKTQDPDCTAKDFAESRFVPKCTSPGDSTAREFARARDKHSDACWIQSKGSEALSILVIAEFDPST